MVRTKKMAKRDTSVTPWKHAEGESSKPHLSDEGSELPPPRNNLPSSTLFPKITEELDSFNTAHEKEPSEESDDQHASSAREEVQIDKVATTSSDPAPPKPPSAPLETAPSESHRSATPNPSKDNSEPVEKVQEDAQTEGVVSLGSSSDEISEKQGRKKRVMKILGLGTSKRLKISKSEAPRQSSLDQPNAASGSQAITQNASVSSRVRSRKASERGTAVEVSPVTKRIDQFLRRKIIVERLVDTTEKDQWGYVEIIAKGSMGTTVSSLGNYVEQVIAEFYAGLPVTKVEADAEEVEVQSELADFITEGTRKEWENLTTADLSPRYGALMIIAAYNWIPSTHKTHVSIDRARLVYKMARGIRVDMGRLIFKQVMNLGVLKVMWSTRKTRMPPPVLSPSISPTSSNMTAPRRFVAHDLGSVSIPQGLLTQEDLQAVLQKTTRALQALTGIVQDLSRSVAGTCETQGLKRGRLKMYGQDGAVVVHEIPDVLWYKMDLSNNICRCGYLSFNGVTILFRSRRKRVMPTNPPFFLILKLILMVEESFYNLQRPAKTKIIYCGFNRRVARPSSRYERVSERKRNSE
ncbi:hypothetical protein F2Q69_00009192 [Brassica cretica]|uniref:Uncharacterized protein n=1 Tax=Brassica cretica TaxID=69181 RepID=A0A8S9P7U2_BRACR|nr:hypothetical protein F2Q69_00009192 [Brassica cretica]